MSSMPSSSLPSATLVPLEASSSVTASCCPAPSRPYRPQRPQRPRRVLYPAYQSRRPPLKEAPDQARRWLLLLSALVFLQIYMEDSHSCTELQNQCPDPLTSPPSEGDGSVCAAQEWRGEEPWRLEVVMAGASDHQQQCVVL